MSAVIRALREGGVHGAVWTCVRVFDLVQEDFPEKWWLSQDLRNSELGGNLKVVLFRLTSNLGIKSILKNINKSSV